VSRCLFIKSAFIKLNGDMTSVEEVAAMVTRLKPMGAGAVGVTEMPAALASLITAYWTDIWRVLRGG
jgi:hypothetical protein